ncbi:MAG TPA: hypothetical protein VHO25_22085 [Polyangiaceae bacterium]|nr:hypothetical protein [Polyangiaceae bacterium]
MTTTQPKTPWIIIAVAIFASIFLLGREAMKPQVTVNVEQVRVPALHAEPVASAAPVLPANIPDAGPSTPPNWQTVKSIDYPSLVGKWVGEDSDAIAGGKLVVGGARLEIVAGREGSKTPFNVRFTVPRKGDDSTTAGGGCGFDEDSDAYCVGYGMALGDAPYRRTKIAFQRMGLRLRVTVKGLFTVDLLQDGEAL